VQDNRAHAKHYSIPVCLVSGYYQLVRIGEIRVFVATIATTVLILAFAGNAAESRGRYDSDYDTLARIAEDLYRALPKDKRAKLLPNVVLLKDIHAPYLQPAEQTKDSTNAQAICVSPALIDLLNYVSHARAVDNVDSGFFNTAIDSLAADKGSTNFARPSHPKSWDFNTMNWQLSYFNQMAAGLVAVEMAHHYLGHYRKYASQSGDSKKPAPFYSVLSQKEWREAVLVGSRHALDCGLAPEGLIVLYDAISRMPKRPSWAVQVMPPSAEVSILRLELKRVEATFFDSRTAAREEFRWTW
jgi:hypothetical protein